MRFRTGILLAILLWGWNSAALAGTTDILTLSTSVTNQLGGAPYVNQVTLVDVSVKNNGPDAHISTSDSGLLKITVDIDEPSKPGLPSVEAFHYIINVNVNIAAGATTILHLGNIGYVPHVVGVRTATTNSTATTPNVDPSSGNDTAATQFFVQTTGGGSSGGSNGSSGGGAPAMGAVGFATLGFMMLALTWWGVRRRSARRKT